MTARKRYALVGTGGRAGMYVRAIADTYRDSAELVAFCDLSQTRMNFYNARLQSDFGQDPIPTYPASDFDRMIVETKPDTVIVTTIDATHHQYIVRAMELGCDAISEKPMTTDEHKASAIFDAIERTGKHLRVTFNYRYAPAYTRLREIIMQGTIGKPTLVDFAWVLDTHHGADYFRRWHREKHNSGGLLVHKATHHFDLINWWIDSYPKTVFAMGDLKFYGKENAEARGEHYSYARYTGEPEAANDPFALFLDQDPNLRGLYLDAEADSGYLRDRNVFGEPVTIEDTMAVTARYRSGALLSYSLVAYAPWEGFKVMVTGTKGRAEMDIIESVEGVIIGSDDEARNLEASKGTFKYSQIRVYPMFAQPYEAEIPSSKGGHGGADPVMLEQIFSPNPPDDPFKRAASHIDGAASILMGISANKSMATGLPVNVDDLLKLPEKETSPTTR
ncbi:MAG: Gfo/Idh/MocA family oxidoreductase [Anaerolineae bacterium]|nr:Gfo/Idh/MocA family oxidoreductase [Anaerolineae bacterium]